MDSIIPLGQKNTLAEYMILSGADNRPPMLDKDLYDSWKSRMELYMQNREHGRMILVSVENEIQADCDMKATNIILQGLPANIYSVVNHHRVAKDLWERVQLLMQCTSLTKQERECKLMKMEQFQVNTKFLNSLLPEWSKFVTDVKLVKDLHTTNFDQLHAYLEQHELHANESPQVSTQPMIESPLMHSGFAVPVFSLGDDPIACLNKAMTFLTDVASSRFPSTNNQLRTSLNPRNQATIQDGRVIVQQVQGKQGQSYSGTGYKSNATSSWGNNASGQAKVVKCYNCQARQILDEEQLAFLADPGVPDGQAVQTIIPNNAAFQTKNLDTYDSDCDDISNAKVVLIANISNYGSDVISEVPHSDTYLHDMENQGVHAMQDFEQPPVMDFLDNEIHSNSNINLYSQYLQETQLTIIQDTTLQAQQDSMILSVIEQISREKMIDSQMDDMIKEKLALKEQVNSLEQNLSKQIKEKECLLQTFTVFKSESKEKEDKYMENEIDLEKKIKELDNTIYKVGQSAQTVHIKPSDSSPVKIEAPKELPKVSLVNESLKKLKFHLARFDNVMKIRTTPDARIEDLLNEIMEVQTVFDQMDVVVQQSSVDKQCLEIAKKELLLENDRLLQQIMSQDVILTVMNSMSLIGESVNMDRKRNESCDKCFNLDAELLKSQNAHNDLLKKFFENNDLKAQLQDKDSTISQLQDKVFVITSLKNDLRKVKGKEIVDIATQIPSATTIVPGMFKLDLEPLAPRLFQNREAHLEHLKYTQEQADILQGIVELSLKLNKL
ncbi:hypothetical protein Tco_0122813 [Tanacetum coccineum]